MGTGIEATSANAEPSQLGMVDSRRGVESLLEATSTYCGELFGVEHDYVFAPTRTYLYVSLARVIPCCSLCFQV